MTRRGDWMQTYTGKQFWPLDPRPEDVDILDIAHALSHVCRFGGHVWHFYSVAEHSLMVAEWLEDADQQPREVALAGLLHDAAEAYIGDMVRPLKQYMPEYREVEKHLLYVIGLKFNVELHPVRINPRVHHADNVILATEKRDVMWNEPAPWAPLPPPWEIPIDDELTPTEAKATFLREFHRLSR